MALELSGEKYRRITKENATYVTTDSKDYKWKGETKYHYFKYQPIKWRVLSVNGSEAFMAGSSVYAKAMGIESYGRDCGWWLRTQDAYFYGYITLVDCDGLVGSFFAPVSYNGIGVHPALS